MYERTQIAFDSRFDHFIAGDETAIDESAKRGWNLFNTRARCNKCNALSENERDATFFIDNDFHNIGIGIIRHNVVALARDGSYFSIFSEFTKTHHHNSSAQTRLTRIGRSAIIRSLPWSAGTARAVAWFSSNR